MTPPITKADTTPASIAAVAGWRPALIDPAAFFVLLAGGGELVATTEPFLLGKHMPTLSRELVSAAAGDPRFQADSTASAEPKEPDGPEQEATWDAEEDGTIT
ncbi:hypothetical protein FRC00_008682, partial [Tulasnella sp. 408]